MRGEFQPAIPPIPYVVKRLIIVNLVVWFVAVLVLQNWIFKNSAIFDWFGFTPFSFVQNFWFWQPLTYMFVHSENVFHLIFNLLLLWWLGAELEIYWGRRYFLFYYLTCGVGAVFIYLLIVLIYAFASGNVLPLKAPVVGASGAIFGMILAYGIVFGERIVYFLMLFPMRSKHFVMIIGAVEVMNLLSQGFSSDVANLAHLGGLVTGYIILKIGPRLREIWLRRQTRSHGRKLKLVVDNQRPSSNGPKYWN